MINESVSRFNVAQITSLLQATDARVVIAWGAVEYPATVVKTGSKAGLVSAFELLVIGSRAINFRVSKCANMMTMEHQKNDDVY